MEKCANNYAYYSTLVLVLVYDECQKYYYIKIDLYAKMRRINLF